MQGCMKGTVVLSRVLTLSSSNQAVQVVQVQRDSGRVTLEPMTQTPKFRNILFCGPFRFSFFYVSLFLYFSPFITCWPKISASPKMQEKVGGPNIDIAWSKQSFAVPAWGRQFQPGYSMC